MKTYALIDMGIGRRFSFNAENQEDAISKVKGWCRYHSYNYNEDIKNVEEINEDNPFDLHNDFMD